MTYKKTLHNKENRIKIAKVKMLGTQREINDMKIQGLTLPSNFTVHVKIKNTLLYFL